MALTWLKGAAGNLKPAEVSSSDPLPMGLQSAAIVAPTDIQAILRSQAFLTTANLAAGATYTSPTIDCIQFKRITGRVFMDQPSEVQVQFSDDGTTWDIRTLQTAAANTLIWFNDEVLMRYARVTIRNTDGITATTVLRGSGYPSVE